MQYWRSSGRLPDRNDVLANVPIQASVLSGQICYAADRIGRFRIDCDGVGQRSIWIVLGVPEVVVIPIDGIGTWVPGLSAVNGHRPASLADTGCLGLCHGRSSWNGGKRLTIEGRGAFTGGFSLR